MSLRLHRGISTSGAFILLCLLITGLFRAEYIVLENLTSRYTYPCILDLKVGSGNHDDHDSEKRLRHQQVKENSTTGTLHLRLGGTQVS